MRRHLASIGIATALLATTAAASFAQSEAPRPSARSEAPRATAVEPALDGYCPVAYVAMNQATKGDPQHKSEHDGRTYYFSNAQAKQLFDAAPARYLPAYDGFSATGVSMGVKLRSNPRVFALRNGRTYLFSDAQAKAAFEEDAAGVIAKADANWPAVKRRK